MALQPGRRLGRYTVIELLGKGGMGEVYRGRDERLEREVAIKVLPKEMAASPSRLQRFETEARAASALNHPNIVTVHDVGESDGVHFIVMEYVDGIPLGAAIRNGLSTGQIQDYARQIAEGLARAHRAGIIHRDLKPANIVVDSEDRIKILDFGLAKLFIDSAESQASTIVQGITREGSVLGTLGYMSPEQARGLPLDPKSDQFAFGALLYEMATGRAAFRGGSEAEVLSAILRDHPPINEVPTSLPMGYRTIIACCLAKDPTERYRSTDDLVAALHEAPTVGDSVSGSRGGSSVIEGSNPQRLSPRISGSDEDVGSAPAESPARAEEPRQPSETATAGGQIDLPGRDRRPRLLLPVAAILLGLVGFWLWQSRGSGDSAVVDGGSVVAVLPFDNLTGSPDLDYLGRGLAAGVISELSNLPGISLVGRALAWELSESGQPIANLAERLGATVLVEGQLQSQGEQLLVEAQLLDGTSGVILWSRSFTGARDTVFKLQQSIALSLSTVLSIHLSTDARKRLARGGPAAAAFDYYLQGLERLADRTAPRHEVWAESLFREAIRIDGDTAVFHAALSDALTLKRSAGGEVDPEEPERAARRALELDPGLAEGHMALARALRNQGRYAESVAELKPILSAHPKPDEAFRELAVSYELAGDTEEAFAALRNSVALGPDNWFNWNWLGQVEATYGQPRAALDSLTRAVELAPDSVHWPHLNRGGVELMLGEYDKAILDFEATGATTSDPDLAANMAYAYFYQGRFPDALKLYTRSVELAPGSHIHRRNLGDALAAVHDEESARAQYLVAIRLVEDLLVSQPNNNEFLAAQALYSAKLGRCEEAVKKADDIRSLLSEDWQDHLQLAGTYALCGRGDSALDELEIVRDSGVLGSQLRNQPELAALAGDPRFVGLTSD